MAKRGRPKKQTEENKFKKELTGIIIVLISIIGLGTALGFDFGPVGKIIVSFMGFLAGTLHFVLLITLLIVGIFMIIRRGLPKLLSSKMLGAYIIFISALVLVHINFIDSVGIESIFSDTIANFEESVQDINKLSGGGLLGASLSWALIQMLAVNGAKIVAYTLLGIGILIFTGMSLFDLLKNLKFYTKKAVTLNKKPKITKEDIEKVEEDYETDNKIVVSSVDELISQTHAEEKVEEKEEVKK